MGERPAAAQGRSSRFAKSDRGVRRESKDAREPVSDGGTCVALAVAAAAVWIWMPRRPVAASLAAIASEQRRWQGVLVQVGGTLLEFHDPVWPDYGVIQDAHEDRIGIRRIAPWRALVGQRVVAVGTVAFDPQFGRYLAHPQLRLAGGG